LHHARVVEVFELGNIGPSVTQPRPCTKQLSLVLKSGKTFSDDDEVQDTVMMWIREQAGDFYDAGINKLVPRLTKCIVIHGDCVGK
jgi:hypothetical protein